LPKTEAKKKILLLFTGGTIGSSSKEGVIDVDSNTSLLLSLFTAQYPALDVEFTPLSIANILSENIELHDIKTMINTIKIYQKDFDGIILTHGTDTLAFSAAILSLYFHSIAVPLLLVSSHKVLQEKDANGIINLYVATQYILQQKVAGVFVAYKNDNEVPKIHQGSKITQSFQLSSRFESLNNKAYMHFENETFKLKQALETYHCNTIDTDFAQVNIIVPYPTLDYENIHINSTTKLLHTTYHSGTVNEKVLNFIATCKQKDVDIYFCGITKADVQYSSTQKLIESGATILYDVSVEMAYAILLFNVAISTESHAK